MGTEKGKTKHHPGPVYSEDGIPYDYIIIIDSGSTGSRVFVYNWLNPYHVLEKTKVFSNLKTLNLRLVRLFDTEEKDDQEEDDQEKNEQEDIDEESGQDADNEDDGEDVHQHQNSVNKQVENNLSLANMNESGSENSLLNHLPKIFLSRKWHRKVKPGLSSFKSSPHKIGKAHLKHLLSLAANVVPKSQHYRTPIFLHSTAGMRLLTPTEQSILLDNVCSYFTQKSDFFMPDCPSHVNVIDGSVEGIYGWLSINYMKESFDHPENHQHGKNHTTYGLLDMGGASTQVVFQPNSTEIQEHQNNLFDILLYHTPHLNGANYSPPKHLSVSVYSDSFLGFGMYQAHTRFLTSLVDEYQRNHPELKITAPIVDPCLPKGYTYKAKVLDFLVDFVGESNFKKCLTKIFPVLANSTHNTNSNQASGNCQQFSEENDVSSCLLNDLIPAFDFDINHFIGVSGYWDSVQSLMSYSKSDKEKRTTIVNKIRNNLAPNNYDYQFMYNETAKLCGLSFSSLLEINDRKPKHRRLKEEELAELCFKSSWILNFLHIGLGFPRFGIDELHNKENDFISLQLVEELGGSAFSWTLGRALLYANDEYIQAYNNYTNNLPDENRISLKRPGFSHSASKSIYRFGAEQKNIPSRPQFIESRKDASYNYYEYEISNDDYKQLLKWDLEPHRWFGFGMFFIMIGFIAWLMVGSSRRSLFVTSVKEKVLHLYDRITHKIGRKRNTRYIIVDNPDDAYLESGLELDNIRNSEDNFKIDTDDETI